MSDINTITVTGRIERFGELEFIGDNRKEKLPGRIAVSRYDKGRGKSVPEFHAIAIWGQRARFAHKYIGKGDAVTITGQLRASEWTAANGDRNTRIFIDVSDIVAGRKKGDRERGAE